MSALAVVHVAAPMVAGADAQWCHECGAVLSGTGLRNTPWPTGAWVAMRAGMAYVLTIFGIERPFGVNERCCTDRSA